MTALNFPDSPSNGDTYQGYTYNSTKTAWAKPEGSATTVVANVAALPTSAATGDQAFVTGTNRLYLWNGSGWYNIALINTTPSISGVSATYDLAIDGTATTVTITATDPEGLPITYSIASDTSGNIATVTQGTGSNTNVFTITPSTNTAHAGTFSLTFRASDGVNLATAASSFTLQFKVVNSNYTTGLFTSVGANNAVNNSFDDKSTSDHTLTAAGAAHQTTFSPYRHGGYSAFFDGSGDYLTVADHADLDGFSGDFTIEFWFYATSSGDWRTLITKGTAATTGPYLIYQRNANLNLYLSSNGSSHDIAAGTTISTGGVTLNRWHHFALARDGNSYRSFLNGSLINTITSSSGLVANAQNVGIGAANNGAEPFNGYMRDVRIVNGTALYTANFTPPTEPLTAVTNTKLLTCHLPYFADGSTNGHTITINNDTHTRPFSPYDASEYATGSHGGSISLDGSGDSISAAASADFGFGTGDFTVEWWIYFDSIGSYPYQIDMRSADNDTPLALFTRTNLGNELGVYVSASIIASGTYSFKPGIWTHYAICKTGGYLKGYFNGKQDFSIACTRDYGSSESIRIGAVYGNGNYFVDGNIADVRIVKGTAVYTSAFTPPTAPLSAVTNTKLLVQSTDAAIIDKSQFVKTITLNGNVKSSTTQSKYLSSSMYFDGTGDYLSCGALGHNFNDGQNTIEMWIYPTNVSSNEPALFEFYTDDGNNFRLQIYTGGGYSGDLRFLTRSGNGGNNIQTAGASVVSANSWQHIACVRNSSNYWDVYVDGTKVITGSFVHSFDTTNVDLRVGKVEYGTDRYFEGYMSDFRVTKGLARYTSNFTAPTAALKG